MSKSNGNGSVLDAPKNRIPETTKKKVVEQTIVISPPNLKQGEFPIVGTSPYVQHKFSEKVRKQMLQAQQKAAGTKGKKREARNVEEEYKAAMHLSEDGKKNGIPCAAFRNAMIDACRTAGFVMTKAKMTIFCLPDFYDKDGVPLVHLIGTPEPNESPVRLESGVASVAIRPMWKEWRAIVKLQWDGDQFTFEDVGNLLARAGMQVGVGEGRNFSKSSHGMGWGTFKLVS